MSMNYRGWRIHHDPPPIPDRNFDWCAVHEDFDGPGDNRQVCAATLESVKEEIDNFIEEQEL